MDKEKIQKALEGIQREVPGCIMVGLAKEILGKNEAPLVEELEKL